VLENFLYHLTEKKQSFLHRIIFVVLFIKTIFVTENCQLIPPRDAREMNQWLSRSGSAIEPASEPEPGQLNLLRLFISFSFMLSGYT